MNLEVLPPELKVMTLCLYSERFRSLAACKEIDGYYIL